jgi:hypothetical protein
MGKKDTFPEVKRPDHEAEAHLHLATMLRMRWIIPPLPHAPSCRAKEALT